jgi:hypothetical protein
MGTSISDDTVQSNQIFSEVMGGGALGEISKDGECR